MGDRIILNYATPARSAWRGEYAAWWWARLFYALGGILVPLICWGASFSDLTPKPDWQSGRLNAYTSFLLQGKVAYPLFAFMLYSMACLALLLVQREFFARFVYVRAGVYSALPQAAAFSLILAGGDSEDSTVLPIMLVCSGVMTVLGGTAIGFWWLTRLVGWRVPILLALVGAVGGGVAGVGIALTSRSLSGLVGLVFAPGLLILGGGPVATLLAFAVMAFYLCRHPRDCPARPARVGVFWGLWTGAYGTAATIAVIHALEAYSKLPTTRPSRCYIASAAARGHRRFVASAPSSSDPTILINDQLRTLKAFEITLQTLTPGLHRGVRMVYDRVGPRLAAHLTGPVRADVAYVTLKPAEYLARVALHLLGAGPSIAKLYP